MLTPALRRWGIFMANGVGAIKFTRLPRPTGGSRGGSVERMQPRVFWLLGSLSRDMPPRQEDETVSPLVAKVTYVPPFGWLR